MFFTDRYNIELSMNLYLTITLQMSSKIDISRKDTNLQYMEQANKYDNLFLDQVYPTTYCQIP